MKCVWCKLKYKFFFLFKKKQIKKEKVENVEEFIVKKEFIKILKKKFICKILIALRITILAWK